MELYKIGMLVLLLVFCLACGKEEYDAPEEQPVYFEYHFINHAWGLSEPGTIAASCGTGRFNYW
jgi:hypothetical protein